MAQEVAATARLNRSLAAWQTWDLPHPLQTAPRLGPRIGQGSGHTIFEIDSDQSTCTPLLARIRTRPTRSIEGGFPQEMAAWQTAADAGLAPKLVYVDHHSEVAICQKSRISQAPVSGTALGQLCKQIHSLPKVCTTLQLRNDIETYLSLMTETDKADWQIAMRACLVDEALTLLEQDTLHFCHNDLTASNLMVDDHQLIAIDWEYAAMSSRYFDIAIAAASLESRERARLIDIVFADTANDRLLRAGRCIAGLVTALWQTQFTPLEAPNPAAWASKCEPVA